MEIHHFSHHHKLSFVEVGMDAESVRCYGCSRLFNGPAYTCKNCPGFFLHKSCTELPRHIHHAFHHQHSLTLYPLDMFVCDGCGELCMGLVYRCGFCMFSLDVKCATLDQNLARSTAAKGAEIKITVNHFSHNHLLTRCISVVLTRAKKGEKEEPVPCLACSKDINGKLIFTCLSCGFYLHESCLNNMPEQIQSSFHPVHPLLAQPLGRDTGAQCGGCGDAIYGISFNCIECNFNLHVSCAKYQTRSLKHDCHHHPLLLLGKSNVGRSQRLLVKCNECGQYCKEAFLTCLDECNFFIHLECVPLPSVAKHVRHLHLLTLTDSVVEDDSGEYYCDMCETERNPEHHVYFCPDCNFVAHIDCVMSKVERPKSISSYLVPRPKKKKVEKRDDPIADNTLLAAGDGIMKQRKTEHEDSEEKTMLDNLDAEIKQIMKEMETLTKRYWELGKKRYDIIKSIEDKEGF